VRPRRIQPCKFRLRAGSAEADVEMHQERGRDEIDTANRRRDRAAPANGMAKAVCEPSCARAGSREGHRRSTTLISTLHQDLDSAQLGRRRRGGHQEADVEMHQERGRDEIDTANRRRDRALSSLIAVCEPSCARAGSREGHRRSTTLISTLHQVRGGHAPAEERPAVDRRAPPTGDENPKAITSQ
jgi:hypothetical protein